MGSDLCFKNIMLAAMWKMDCRVAWEDVKRLIKRHLEAFEGRAEAEMKPAATVSKSRSLR